MNEEQKIARDFGKDIDSLIRIRDQAKMDLARSRMKLIEMGAKTVKDGMVTHLPGLNIDKFASCENQEFYWEAEYEDGSVIRQFEGKKQHHYGHIDQQRLKYFRWVSTFDYPTDNEDKRVIISLNFKDGRFEFYNGIVPQETRAEVLNGYPSISFEPKLILKAVKRASTSHSFPDGGIDEVTYYNRFLIGWENLPGSATKGKRILCIEPNGFVHLWHL